MRNFCANDWISNYIVDCEGILFWFGSWDRMGVRRTFGGRKWDNYCASRFARNDVYCLFTCLGILGRCSLAKWLKFELPYRVPSFSLLLYASWCWLSTTYVAVAFFSSSSKGEQRYITALRDLAWKTLENFRPIKSVNSALLTVCPSVSTISNCGLID